jgi:hypothetical protein
MKHFIFLRNSLVQFPAQAKDDQASRNIVGTICSNLLYYGYIFSTEALREFNKLSDENVIAWWETVEPAFKEITGESKNMGDHVVYKNFPKEVLDKSLAEYWICQIFMYLGVPNEFFTTEEVERDQMFESISLKTLQVARANKEQDICHELCLTPARWTDEQSMFVEHLIINEKCYFNLSKIPFKENMIQVAVLAMNNGLAASVNSATDVLRLAIGLSDGDITMRTNTPFRNFTRKERRFLLTLIENQNDCEEDIAMDKNRWKKLLNRLHPGDYKNAFPNVVKANNNLYNNNVVSFNSKLEKYLETEDAYALVLLKSRPGVFARRLSHAISIFGSAAIDAFAEICPKLTVIKLLKVKKFFSTLKERNHLVYPPKSNWAKLQIVENSKAIRHNPQVITLIGKIDDALNEKMSGISVNLDSRTSLVKIQGNDSELTNYGRGTVFPIPENINFIRSASYWELPDTFNNWYDNGWNFFNKDWKEKGACCWANMTFARKGCAFSGDPTNSKTADGKACQMIDLYIDKLLAFGVRYAVWNVLCYSHKKFSEATEVFGALQWGEAPQKGKLFEPSRCQLSFPITGECYTKYIAYIDLEKRELVYMDANFKADVSSAKENGRMLSEVMPAYIEYLNSLPSVFDLFSHAKQDVNGTAVAYDDSNIDIKGTSAYVFNPTNENNSFEQLEVAKFLS